MYWNYNADCIIKNKALKSAIPNRTSRDNGGRGHEAIQMNRSDLSDATVDAAHTNAGNQKMYAHIINY